MKTPPFTDKTDFLNVRRVEKGLSFNKLGKILGLDSQVVNRYFLGHNLPNSDVMARLCELLDIDISKGQEEFQKLHYNYKSSVFKYQPNGMLSKKISYSNWTLLKKIQGALSYEDYLTIYHCVGRSSQDILPLIYGKVDYNTFIKVSEIIEDNRLSP